jgi:hypothetical protein
MVRLQEVFLVDAIKVSDQFLIVGVQLGYLWCDQVVLEPSHVLVEILKETHVVPELTERFREERLSHYEYNTFCTLLLYCCTAEVLRLLGFSALFTYFFGTLDGDWPRWLIIDAEGTAFRWCNGEFIRLRSWRGTGFLALVVLKTWPMKVLPRDTRVTYLFTMLAVSGFPNSSLVIYCEKSVVGILLMSCYCCYEKKEQFLYLLSTESNFLLISCCGTFSSDCSTFIDIRVGVPSFGSQISLISGISLLSRTLRFTVFLRILLPRYLPGAGDYCRLLGFNTLLDELLLSGSILRGSGFAELDGRRSASRSASRVDSSWSCPQV